MDADDSAVQEGRSMSLIDIYIRDKDCDIIRKVGDDKHDQLTINKDGQLQYYNLQNGCGCRTGDPSETYEFVPNEDMWGYNIDPREEGEA